MYTRIYIYMYICIYICISKRGYETCWRKRRAMRTPNSSPEVYAGPPKTVLSTAEPTSISPAHSLVIMKANLSTRSHKQ